MKVWNDPRVQRQVDAAETFVKDKAPDVAEFVSDNAKKVVSQVTGKKPAARSTREVGEHVDRCQVGHREVQLIGG